MTALRPERETDTSYGPSYGESGAFGGWQNTVPGPPHDPYAAQDPYRAQASQEPQGAYPVPGQQDAHGTHGGHPPQEPYGRQASQEPYGTYPQQQPTHPAAGAIPAQGAYGEQEPGDATAYLPPADDETMALRVPEEPMSGATGSRVASRAASRAGAAGAAPGGRAARRKATKGRRGRHGGPAGAAAQEDKPAGAAPAPVSRVEARRRARALKPGPGVLASRVVGEVFITTGVVMLLFVTYQLWWTNIRAHAEAGSEAHQLQDDWASGKRNPGSFEPGQGFAILHIPKLDVVVPIAEGTSKTRVLDKGMVGHYGKGDLNTAMPDAKAGNFGLAGHRNTHGEPFRYINRLTPGDPIVVETQDTYYVYKMASMLPVTSPSNTSVLDPVPQGSGFTGPGRYITLTTCTPEFTSKYRLIVWGRMVEERPRSKGKPDALVS
ncbi:class E sortase [Streptomyces tropicalis]|uniref:Class E sortase n=1 Tax=Streptomyces tropicalis TaxID=3034234 RepID=A0ABT6A8L1_9ACTN|nr:class E sortase [Streptomyces tropicalis]MDF3300969.1 class E sortase [Streptomyces tropicalis]